MMNTLQFGPLVVPAPILLLFGSYTAGAWIGKREARKGGGNAEPVFFQALLVGLLVARLFFVSQFLAVYSNTPLEIIDIRDGGWNPLAGLAGAWIFALWKAYCSTILRKSILIAITVASAVWLLGTALMSGATERHTGLPDIVLPALNGNTVALAGYKGRPTVINLWATWCPPCRREMPILQHAQEKHPETRFVFANQGESNDAVSTFLAQSGLTLQNVLLDSKQQIASHFDQRGLPTTLFFDAGGRLVDMRVGELSEATLAQRLHKISPSQPEIK